MAKKKGKSKKSKKKSKKKNINYPVWSKVKRKTHWETDWSYPRKPKWRPGYREPCSVKKKKYKRKPKYPLGGYDSLNFMTENWKSKPKEYGTQFRTDTQWIKSKGKKGKSAHQKRVKHWEKFDKRQKKKRMFLFERL